METVVKIFKWIFSEGWNFLTGIEIPFLGISYGSVFLAFMILSIAVSLLKLSGYSLGQRGGNSRRKAKEKDD